MYRIEREMEDSTPSPSPIEMEPTTLRKRTRSTHFSPQPQDAENNLADPPQELAFVLGKRGMGLDYLRTIDVSGEHHNIFKVNNCSLRLSELVDIAHEIQPCRFVTEDGVLCVMVSKNSNLKPKEVSNVLRWDCLDYTLVVIGLFAFFGGVVFIAYGEY